MSAKKKKQEKNTDERKSEVKSTESNVAEEKGAQSAEGEEKVKDAPSGESAATGEGSETEALIQDLKSRLEKMTAENAKLKDDLLRKQADFDNFRKRMQREKQESVKYANANLLQDIVTIIDDFERAIRSSEESREFDSFHSGIKMIEKQFISMLERKYGLKRMETVGKEFDPQQHEAIGMEEIPDLEVQTVLEDYQKGYTLNERVLRHAKVKVGVPMVKNKSPEAEEAEADGGSESSGEKETGGR